MALNSLFCADVPLCNYSLTHSLLTIEPLSHGKRHATKNTNFFVIIVRQRCILTKEIKHNKLRTGVMQSLRCHTAEAHSPYKMATATATEATEIMTVIPCRYNFRAHLSSCEVSLSLCVSFAFRFHNCYFIFASCYAAASGE